MSPNQSQWKSMLYFLCGCACVPVCEETTPGEIERQLLATLLTLKFHFTYTSTSTCTCPQYMLPTYDIDIIHWECWHLSSTQPPPPQPNLLLQQLQLVPALPSTPPTTYISQLCLIIHHFNVLDLNRQEPLANWSNIHWYLKTKFALLCFISIIPGNLSGVGGWGRGGGKLVLSAGEIIREV